jgi:hypothetical protein
MTKHDDRVPYQHAGMTWPVLVHPHRTTEPQLDAIRLAELSTGDTIHPRWFDLAYFARVKEEVRD